MFVQSTLIARILSRVRGKVSSKHLFNTEYSDHKWDGLWDVPELARYSVIAGYIRHYCRQPRLLDLGCGEGILLQKFSPEDYSYYAGIDFSDAAIQKALGMQSAKVHFGLGDLNTLQVEGVYDAIIYNESLYYLKDPVKAIRTVFDNLGPEGIIIVSIHKVGMNREWIWEALDGILDLKDKTAISNREGTSWSVGVYKRKEEMSKS